MAHYIIGDVHGCFLTLQAFLETIAFDAGRDRLIFVGDLIGKGPSSYEVLAWVSEQGDAVETLLGNHELHFLRRCFGLRKPKHKDTLSSLLEHPECRQLADWLLQRPVLLRLERDVIVHAGLFPPWTPEQASRWAAHIQQWLRRDPEKTLTPRTPPADAPWEKLAADPDPADAYAAAMALRWVTHVRWVVGGYLPDWKRKKFKTKKAQDPSSRNQLAPWYELWRPPGGNRVFFGHWAALGPGTFGPAVCLDGRCAYGGPLCAYRVEDDAWIEELNRDLPASAPRD
ncbi:MAG: symmetrical bis(5'-nucleosyl)-tetraphosphatase [Acidobacteriota bacterium]